MTPVVTDTVLVPLASESDARNTCRSLREHLDPEANVLAVHVIEKAGGAPDNASVAQREDRAEDIFATVRATLEGFDHESRILYGTDVADTIIDAADEADAELIAFSPQEVSRLTRFLSGDVALDLITETDRPVLVLPNADDE